MEPFFEFDALIANALRFYSHVFRAALDRPHSSYLTIRRRWSARDFDTRGSATLLRYGWLLANEVFSLAGGILDEARARWPAKAAGP